MKKLFVLAMLVCLAFSSFAQTPSAIAPPDPVRDTSSRTFLDKAASYYLTNAKDKASEKKVLEAFSDPKGPWVAGELYLYAYDFEGTCVAHGTKKVLITTNQIKLRDSDGVFMIQKFIEGLNPTTNSAGYYKQRFKFPNPFNGGKVEDKYSVNVRLQTGKLRPIILGTGYYVKAVKK